MPHIVYLESVTGYGEAENPRRLEKLGVPVLDPLPISVYAAQEVAAARV